jgi:hypothetical protein
MIQPPKNFSEALELALTDLAKAEASPLHRVDMNQWHRGISDEDDVCRVCLAGSVMAFSLGANPKDTMAPHFRGDGWSPILLALNELRGGFVGTARVMWPEGFKPTDPQLHPSDLSCEVVPYAADPVLFRRQLEQLVADLRKAGT